MEWEGLACGVGLALVNGLIAWWSIHWTWSRRPQLFIKVFLGGMAVRFITVVAASAALLLLTPIDPGYFMGGLVASYILIQIVEVVAVLRRNERDRTGEAA